MLSFESDYIAGAHPEILKRLTETNLESLPGYGNDHYCTSAKEKIRKACDCPEAEVEFLVGGTQTNAVAVSYTHLDVYKRQISGRRQGTVCQLHLLSMYSLTVTIRLWCSRMFLLCVIEKKL